MSSDCLYLHSRREAPPCCSINNRLNLKPQKVVGYVSKRLLIQRARVPPRILPYGRVRRVCQRLANLVCRNCFFIGLAAGEIGLGAVLGLILGLAVCIPASWVSLASIVKRFHDTDKSGWLILTLIIPVVDVCAGIYLLFADGRRPKPIRRGSQKARTLRNATAGSN